MHMPRVKVLVAALAFGMAASMAAATPALADAPPNRTFVPGDSVRGSLDYDGDVDDVWFQCVRKARIRVRPRAPDAQWAPLVQVLDADGKPLRVSGRASRGRASATLPEAGEFRVRISGPASATGAWELRTSVAFPATARKRAKRLGPAPRDALALDLVSGATMTVLVSPRKGLAQFGLELVTPDGQVSDLMPLAQVDGRGRLMVSGIAASRTGRHLVRATGLTSRRDFVSVSITPVQPQGEAVIAVTEALVEPGMAPVATRLMYRLDPQLAMAASAGTVSVVTALASGAPGASGVALDGVRPDLTQIGFLADGDGEPFAPFVVRSSDATLGDVQIDAARVARGIAGLHPLLLRLDDDDRETFFDSIDTAPSFPFLATAVRDALSTDPAGLGDPHKFPEVYTAADAAVRQTLGALEYRVQKQATVTADCGTFPVGQSLALHAGTAGRAVFVNPRYVFYGVEMTSSGGRTHAFLVKPRVGIFKLWPPGWSDPGTRCVLLDLGRNDFVADSLALSLDAKTAGGRGTLANAMYAGLQVVFQVVRVPLPVSKAELTEFLIDDLLAATDTPENS